MSEQGEQGVKGAEGGQGIRGSQGAEGGQGPQGIAGVQGPQGVKGPHGETGKQGDSGTGGGPRGATGATGAAGKSGSNPNRRLITMFVVMVFAFAVLAWRTEVNADHIKDAAADYQHGQAIARYDGCLRGVQIITKFNMLFDNLAQVYRDAIAADPNAEQVTTQARRHLIKIYEAAVVDLDKDPCGADPR